MAVDATELLQACRVAEGLLELVPDAKRRAAIRVEIEGLRSFARSRSPRGERQQARDVMPRLLMRSVEVLADVERVAVAGTRTEILLAAWRNAETAFSATTPGTLASILACRAVQTARDAYHARISALESPASPPVAGLAHTPGGASRR
jgi:hypothetical protein